MLRKYCLTLLENSKRYRSIFIVILALFFLLFGFKLTHHATPAGVVVAVKEARRAPISPTISVIGNIIAEQGVDVSAKVNGIIRQIYFHSGQVVKKGDLLVALENDDIKALLDQSVAKLNLAKQNYDRYDALVKKGGISHSEFDKVASEFTTDQTQVNYETALLNQTYIRAPFDGKVGIRNINIGQYVSPGFALVNLQAVAPLYVDFNIPEQYVNQVTENLPVNLTLDGASQSIAQGNVVAMGSSLNLETRTLQVRALINTTSTEKLSPGMYVLVNLALVKSSDVILIPQSAIVYSPMGDYVYKSVQHKAQQVIVTLGERIGDDVVVLSGLKQGDNIICAGQIKIHPGVITQEVPYALDK